MWVYRGGDPARPVLIYQYHPTRAGKVPLEFLKKYKGYVQADDITVMMPWNEPVISGFWVAGHMYAESLWM